MKETHGQLIQRIKIKTCGCGRKLRGKELECVACRLEKESERKETDI